MKSYSLPFLILTITSLFITRVSLRDICEENNGNIQIKTAFRLNSTLFLFGQNGQNIKVSDFHWDAPNDKLTIGSVDFLDSNIWNATTALDFTTDLVYPNKGLRVLEVEEGRPENIHQLLAYLLDIDPKSGDIRTKDPISINIYKCRSPNKVEPMYLCSLFIKFPDKNLETNLMSITAFPPSTGRASRLPPRFFVYYKETPNKEAERECPNCYESKRYIMIGKNVTDKNGVFEEINWHIDNSSTVPCIDLRGVLVNASVTITDYIENGQLFEFYLLEFIGTTYNILRIQIAPEQNNKVLEGHLTRKRGFIGELFKCKQATTPEPPAPEPAPTEQPTKKPPEGGPPPEEPEEPEEPPVAGPKTPPEGEPPTPEGTSTTTKAPDKSSSGGLIIIIILILLLLFAVLGVVAWFLIPKGGKAAPPTPPPEPPKPGSPPGPTVDITEAGVTPTPSDTKTIRSEPQ